MPVDNVNQNIYNLNYQQAANLLTPPDKRQPVWLAFLNALLFPLQWLHDLIFTDYANGSSAALYSNSATYAIGNRVTYSDFGVYEYIYTGTPAAGQQPGTADSNGVFYWYKALNSFIGVRQRMQLTGQQLSLEYALNTWFRYYGASFVQPSSYGSFTYPDSTAIANDYLNKSSIYIQQKAIDNDGFFMGQGDGTSSDISQLDTDQQNINNNLGNSYDIGIQYNFVVWVPVAVYNQFAHTPVSSMGFDLQADAVFRSIISQYVIYGMIYNIIPY